MDESRIINAQILKITDTLETQIIHWGYNNYLSMEVKIWKKDNWLLRVREIFHTMPSHFDKEMILNAIIPGGDGTCL